MPYLSFLLVPSCNESYFELLQEDAMKEFIALAKKMDQQVKLAELSNHTSHINLMILNCLPIVAKNLRTSWPLFKNNVAHNGIYGLDSFIQLCEYLCGG